MRRFAFVICFYARMPDDFDFDRKMQRGSRKTEDMHHKEYNCM